PYPLTTPTAPFTLSLHDALPISHAEGRIQRHRSQDGDILTGEHAETLGDLLATTGTKDLHGGAVGHHHGGHVLDDTGDLLVGLQDRKITRLNSRHVSISYAVFCL